MMKLYRLEELTPQQILNRDLQAEPGVEEAVDAIIAEVRARGDAALRDYALKFDGAAPEQLEVTAEEMDAALAAVDPALIETMRQAAANIEAFHRRRTGRGGAGAAVDPRPAGGRLCAGGHRRLPLHRPDGRHPGQGGRRA